MLKERFRERLIQAMQDHGVSAAALAKGSGVSKDQIHKLVQRRVSSTNVNDAMQIARFFGMTLDEFMGEAQIDERARLAILLGRLTPDEREMLEAQIAGLLERRRHP